ncbi:ATP-dependent DNA helicase RecQ [Neoasaia chiangmaiensis NBRC 101099]|uniref:DNA helicase RecQ n=1 Tax=Neoasaia chiangmaiensis TaxID=320497 RepID=A0A1U9KMD1_9PROT|nr:DNA helicase RecQ [Neoasaia chiangmaiensis]AQS86954.1 ATP-dependent DNA helicase RecQ [Neoasaia chiangmaiensis]GBR37679.1 ATP-dependent DNA helicase RecQ [Neoasaia chiangmaiensis NBRC 101099]GEN15067.1 ATP-dependent DNA helicase RecQ [Neoasaia chiangmaiensis]
MEFVRNDFATPSPATEDRSPEAVLRRVFGFTAFRGLQADAVDTVMRGEDALVLMPTGGGKSLCYQVPALCRDGMGLVVSPLIALMDDQVAALRQLGVNAAALHSELEDDDLARIRSDIASSKLDILYISPERLLSPGTIAYLAKRRLSVIAIDEAHCISAWGHEFRPEYRGLAALPGVFPNVPRIALTATADQRTRDDILDALDMRHARQFIASFHRSNLFVSVRPKTQETRQLEDMLQSRKDAASIVYCGSRNKTERVARSLNERGFRALPFHAGLSPQEKRATLTRFRSGEPIVIVATIAFGMGIDRPDVRCVVHLDMPASPEAYYQQIGRAGRDGQRADTLLLYGGEDIARARHWLELSNAPDREKREMHARLESMIALTESVSCRTQALLSCFGETLSVACGHCDNCKTPVSTFDGTEAAQKVLSAIYRTNQRFGAVHLAAVLRGKKTDAVTRHAHQHLSVFGVGREQSETWWRGVIRQLIARGAIRINGEHGALGLVTDIARPILRGEERILLRNDPTASLREVVSRNNAAENLSEEAARRFDSLRAWRLGEAREQEIPPYVIFHDSVLREIAIDRPADLETLARLKGVGGSKLERYGVAVLAALEKAER